jgi:hypothetical protein
MVFRTDRRYRITRRAYAASSSRPYASKARHEINAARFGYTGPCTGGTPAVTCAAPGELA